MLFCFRFQDLTSQLKANVNEAVHQLLQNFEQEFHIEDGDSKDPGKRRHRHENNLISSDEESSFGESSLNQVRALKKYILQFTLYTPFLLCLDL